VTGGRSIERVRPCVTRIDNSKVHRNWQLECSDRPSPRDVVRPFSNRRGTTAGHIWSTRSHGGSTPASTCGFAAPGVGLEPTTYGLTERLRAYADVRRRSRRRVFPAQKPSVAASYADVFVSLLARLWPICGQTRGMRTEPESARGNTPMPAVRVSQSLSRRVCDCASSLIRRFGGEFESRWATSKFLALARAGPG
jgi:hypothetical protein